MLSLHTLRLLIFAVRRFNMLAKLFLILLAFAVCYSHPTVINGVYRDGRGIAISKASITHNNELGRHYGVNAYPEIKAKARVENYDYHEAPAHIKAKATIGNNKDLEHYEAPISFTSAKDAYEISAVGPQYTESTATLNGASDPSVTSYSRKDSGFASSSASHDLNQYIKAKSQEFGTYTGKTTNRNGFSWHFGTLYDTPNDIGSVHLGPSPVKTTYKTLNNVANADVNLSNNYPSIKTSATINGFGVAKSSANIKDIEYSSEKSTANVNIGFVKSEDYLKKLSSTKSLHNEAEYGTVNVDAKVNGFGSAKATVNGSPADFKTLRQSENSLDNGYGSLNAKADINGNQGTVKSFAEIYRAYGSADTNVNENKYASAKTILNDNGSAKAVAELHNNDFIRGESQEQHEDFNDAANQKTLNAVSDFNNFGFAKSTVNSNILSSVKSSANINSYGSASAKANINNISHGLYKSTSNIDDIAADESLIYPESTQYGSIKASADVNNGEHGSLKSFASTNDFGVAKSSATSHGSRYGLVNANADITGTGYGSAKSSVNAYGSDYYRSHLIGQEGPGATANAHISGLGSATSYARTHNTIAGYRTGNAADNSPGYASAHASVHA